MHQTMTDPFWMMLLWNWNLYLLSSLAETLKYSLNFFMLGVMGSGYLDKDPTLVFSEALD